jgi:hypothetical protein
MRVARTGDEFLFAFPKQDFPDWRRFNRPRGSTAGEPNGDAYNKSRDSADHVILYRFLKSTVAQTIILYLLSILGNLHNYRR